MTRAIMGSGEQQKLQRLAELEVRIKDLDVGVRDRQFLENNDDKVRKKCNQSRDPFLLLLDADLPLQCL